MKLVGQESSLPEINNELADKGFFVTSTDEMIKWARTGAIYRVTFGLTCRAIEMMQVMMPRYDLERFGCFPRASPRQSDLMSGAFSASGIINDVWQSSMNALELVCACPPLRGFNFGG